MGSDKKRVLKEIIRAIRSDRGYGILLTVIFLSLGAVNSAHHEMWRDELQAWLIARDSSIIDLPKNLKYEGHPGLWHLSLLPLTRITWSPLIMQVFHLLIAGATVYLFTTFSPFGKVQKALFPFGYFTFYEYAVICRNYALGFLLLILFCLLFPKRWERFPIIGIILLLASHTSVHALILVISIAVMLLWDFISSDHPVKRGTYIGFILILIGIITSIIQLKPPSDSGFAVGWKFDFDPDHLKRVIGLIPRSFIPIPRFIFHFWNTNFLDAIPSSTNVKLSLACLILLWCLILLLRKPIPLLFHLLGTLGLCAFFYTKYFGSMRHHGFLFITFLISAWISTYCDGSTRIFRPLRAVSMALEKSMGKVMMAILFLHLVGGVSATGMDFKNPFSQGKSAASFIREGGFDEMMIVGHEDMTLPIIGYLQKDRFYYPRSRRFGSFGIWDINWRRTRRIPIESVLQEVKRVEEGEVLIIFPSPLKEEIKLRYSLAEIGRFEKAIVGEIYYLYVMR